METFQADIAHFNPNNPYTGDERTPVQFYMGVLVNDAKSTEAGRPIHEDVEYIRILNSKDNILDRPVRDTDKQRWPRAYAAWKATGESTPGAGGTRLEQWPLVSRAQVEEFKYFKIYTVEQLAEIPDSIGGQIMGVQRLKAMAKAHVEIAKGEAPLLKMQAALEERDATIAGLTDQVAKLAKRLDKMTSKE
jgi:hypothetical protein